MCIIYSEWAVWGLVNEVHSISSAHAHREDSDGVINTSSTYSHLTTPRGGGEGGGGGGLPVSPLRSPQLSRTLIPNSCR